jgi:TetR/AcrR family transcriptional regulator, regulator of cefoperazone and chloramphenicol sensitivity
MKLVATPRRRPKKGGYTRGDATRAQIIAAALKIFGEHGYDRAATRDIALEASVNPPALQYYFDGKAGLHRACAQFIIDRASVTLGPALEQAQRAIKSGRSSGVLDAVVGLLDAMTDSFAEPDSEIWSRFIHRGKADGAGPGVELIREKLSVPILDAVANLLALATGQNAADDEVRLRAMLILSQVHAVHTGRENMARFMRWKKFDLDKITLLKLLIRQNTCAAIEAATSAAAHAVGRRRSAAG